MKRAHRILYCIATVIALSPFPGLATTTQAFEKSWKICAEQTLLQERVAGIPQYLLTAISKAESGRWDDTNKASIAWPWTVTSGGEGRFYDSRQEALAEVRRLKAAGVKNIDVGCMQVNLMHHGHQFASIEHAMDPAANVAYAATFLKSPAIGATPPGATIPRRRTSTRATWPKSTVCGPKPARLRHRPPPSPRSHPGPPPAAYSRRPIRRRRSGHDARHRRSAPASPESTMRAPRN